MFVYLGGEWEVSTGYIEAGLIGDMGRQHNGYMFYTEHRYYGESQPLPDWSTDNIKYLSVDQALADVAYFIQYIKAHNPQLADAKVVVTGVSYSAEMSTWMRLKYPHLVDAAWASSAPLVAQVDFPEYYEVIGHNIKLVSPDCHKLIEDASSIMRTLMQTPEGLSKISQHFYTCTPLKNSFPHNQHFWNTYTEVFAGIVQYAFPGVIQTQCERLLNASGNDAMEKMGSFVREYYNGGCIGDYDEFLAYYAGPSITYGIYRQWYYQICTEFAYLQTTTSANQPFGQNTVTPEYFDRVCYDLFGEGNGLERMKKSVERTNLQYGGRNKALTKVVSIHGSVDPWHPPGILESLHELAPARLVQGSAHGHDMGSIIPCDSPQLQEAKQLVKDSIAKWIL